MSHDLHLNSYKQLASKFTTQSAKFEIGWVPFNETTGRLRLERMTQ